MNNLRYISCFVLIFLLQLALTKYCQIGSYIYICLLPALILSLPTSYAGWYDMLIAFICAIIVDGFADGQWGMNAAALIPAAALRKSFISIFIGSELVERGYSFSFYTNGIGKVGAAMLATMLVYMSIYVFLDCAGVRSWGFMAMRLLLSSLVSMIFSMIAINILCPRPKR